LEEIFLTVPSVLNVNISMDFMESFVFLVQLVTEQDGIHAQTVHLML